MSSTPKSVEVFGEWIKQQPDDVLQDHLEVCFWDADLEGFCVCKCCGSLVQIRMRPFHLDDHSKMWRIFSIPPGWALSTDIILEIMEEEGL